MHIAATVTFENLPHQPTSIAHVQTCATAKYAEASQPVITAVKP
jgi:hypothetical protein